MKEGMMAAGIVKAKDWLDGVNGKKPGCTGAVQGCTKCRENAHS